MGKYQTRSQMGIGAGGSGGDASASAPPPPDAAAAAAAASSISSKIPFRSRKIRKLSSNSNSKKITILKEDPPLPFIPRPLTFPDEVSSALSHLRSVDPVLGRVIDVLEPPSFQAHSESPFHSLARSILYQQLAMKAAASIYSRFLSLCGGGEPLPLAVLGLSAHQLRQIGVSARKASYLHDLASKFHSGILSDSAVLSMDDKSLFSMLTMVKGIGPWSVHMFMIFSLHRPDVLPVGDLGVRKGVQALYGLDEPPSPSRMEQLCDKWKPYRSVGAWYMWRLLESKGSPTMASVEIGGTTTIAITNTTVEGEALQLQQQMLPDLE